MPMSYNLHRKGDLLEIILESLRDDDWGVIYLHDPKHHPFVLRIYKGGISFDLRIYIWNLTHGGGPKRPTDEYRIQITGVDQFEGSPGEKVLILGWWEEGGVFAGFDYNHHRNRLGTSPSIQIREEALRGAYVNGFATWQRDNDEIAIAFRPDFFAEYVANLEGLHSFGQSTNDLQVLEQVIQQPNQINTAELAEVTPERRQIVVQVTKKLRDNSFKKRILTAYSCQCAFCSVQLKLIDAAHVIPVEEGGSDETANGIALCAIHHRAYDRKLVTFREDYTIVTNIAALDNLSASHHGGGRTPFETLLRPLLILPPAVNDRPNITYVRRANEIRGWSA